MVYYIRMHVVVLVHILLYKGVSNYRLTPLPAFHLLHPCVAVPHNPFDGPSPPIQWIHLIARCAHIGAGLGGIARIYIAGCTCTRTNRLRLSSQKRIHKSVSQTREQPGWDKLPQCSNNSIFLWYYVIKCYDTDVSDHVDGVVTPWMGLSCGKYNNVLRAYETGKSPPPTPPDRYCFTIVQCYDDNISYRTVCEPFIGRLSAEL